MIISDYFDSHLINVKFNNQLALALYKYQVYLTTKNEEHMLFYGSGLTGFYSINTSVNDVNMLFNNILDADFLTISRNLNEIDDIKIEFVVSSDTFNLVIVYLFHKFMNAPLEQKKKDRILFDLILILQYKMMTGVIKKYFKFPTDEKTATATFDSLSNRFLLKRLGSWQEYLNYRTHEIIKNPKFTDTFKHFSNTTDVIIRINDIYGALNDTVKNIYGFFLDVSKNNNKLNSRKETYEGDNGEQLADVSNKILDFQDKVMGRLKDNIRLTSGMSYKLVLDMNKSVEKKKFKEVVEVFSEDLLSDAVGNIVKETIVILSEELKTHPFLVNKSDPSGFMTDLKFMLLKNRAKSDCLEILKVTTLKYLENKKIKFYLGKETRYALSLLMFIYVLAVMD